LLHTHSTPYAAPVVASFRDVCFGFDAREILSDVNFSIRDGSKVTIMGQNGAGKSSIIKLLSGEYWPESGDVNVKSGQSVAVAKQTMPVECRDMTVEDYFVSQFETVDEDEHPEPHLIPAMIASVLREVELNAPLDRIIKSFSGGQQVSITLLLCGTTVRLHHQVRL
jgi:ATPase subunit of ABC transporter with duplicated ATPase domains